MFNATHHRPMLAAALAAGALAATALAGDSSSWLYLPCAEGSEGNGTFTAMVTYSWTGGSTSSISVELTNTGTSMLSDGYITAIALNGAPGTTGMSFISCTSANFGGLAGPVNAAPFGDFMVGASLGQNWEGGGQPSNGIAVGVTETFVFSMAGDAALLGSLSAQDCLDSTGYAMAIRFRGGEGGKVLGCAVPGPGAAALFAIGGLLGRRRRS